MAKLAKNSRLLSNDDDVAFQPWFMPKPVTLQIRKILPSVHLAKMRYYFEDHGCLRCERRDLLYGSNGFCENCCTIVRGRMVNCLKRRLRNVGVGTIQPEPQLSDSVALARNIIHRRIRRDAR
jgi:hypothetical protein